MSYIVVDRNATDKFPSMADAEAHVARLLRQFQNTDAEAPDYVAVEVPDPE